MSILVAQNRGQITTQNLVANGVATANSAVEMDVFGATSMSIQVTGTYTGALSVQVTSDGLRWETITGAVITSMITGVATATIASAAVGIFTVPVHGALRARVTALAAVTGTATVTVRSLENPSVVYVVQPTAGNLNMTATVGSGTLTAVTTLSNGQAAHDAVIAGSPHRIAGRALTANYAAVASGDTADLVTTLAGSLVTQPYAIPEQNWNANLSLTTTTAQAAAAAAGAGLKRHITAVQATNTGTANDLIILDGATERWRMVLPQNVPVSITFQTGLIVTANTALNFNLSAAGTVRVTAQGYTAP